MQQSNRSKIALSGMSDTPNLLSYPPIAHIDSVPEIKERLVYLIEGYELNGISVLLFFENGALGMKIGDWDGNLLSEREIKNNPIAQNATLLCELMAKARIKQAQFYFSNNGKLVDIRTHLNHMVGPGMLRDLCGKIVPIQDIVDVQPLTQEVLNGIDRYIILKHSSFKVIVREGEMVPMYAIAGVNNEKINISSKKTS